MASYASLSFLSLELAPCGQAWTHSSERSCQGPLVSQVVMLACDVHAVITPSDDRGV